jgi:hypothetical protein
MDTSMPTTETDVTVSRAKRRPSSWHAVSDNIADDPKLLQCSIPARLAYHDGLAYCSKWRTDGLIIESALSHVFRGLPNADTIPKTLVTAGLWESCPEGYRVINYLDWQPSKEEIEAARASGAARSQRNRDKEKERRSADKQRGVKAAATRASRARDAHLMQASRRPDAPIVDVTPRIRREVGANA